MCSCLSFPSHLLSHSRDLCRNFCQPLNTELLPNHRCSPSPEPAWTVPAAHTCHPLESQHGVGKLQVAAHRAAAGGLSLHPNWQKTSSAARAPVPIPSAADQASGTVPAPEAYWKREELSAAGLRLANVTAHTWLT